MDKEKIRNNGENGEQEPSKEDRPSSLMEKIQQLGQTNVPQLSQDSRIHCSGTLMKCSKKKECIQERKYLGGGKMPLTPLDIHNKEFSKGFRGYDEDEVNEFLDQVIKDYEMVIREKKELEERLNDLTERLGHFNIY